MSDSIKMNILLFLLFCFFSVYAYTSEPPWVSRLPFDESYFFGVGTGISEQDAEQSAKKEILMQMSSHVNAVISIEVHSGNGATSAQEDIESFFSNNTLRGAEYVDRYEANGHIWLLMRYCTSCGNSLIKSALNHFEDTLGFSSDELIIRLSEEKIAYGFMVEQRLRELKLKDFNSDDIIVRFNEDNLIIMIINFIPYMAELTERQRDGLSTLGETLLKELSQIEYHSIDVIGHANPTGGNEESELNDLSHSRAQILADILSSTGLSINSVLWKGGKETIGNLETAEGRSMNRRVEIMVNFK